MSDFFLDASALIKRYLTEVGTGWVRSRTVPANGNTIIVAEITEVEVAAALAARHRASGGISLAERNGAVRLLVQHCTTEYRLISNTRAVLDRAVNLTQNYRLRGYDAVQLATALVVNDALVAAGFPALVFVASDNDLLAAARGEGLSTDNPNRYP